jgi:hypothetical protein
MYIPEEENTFYTGNEVAHGALGVIRGVRGRAAERAHHLGFFLFFLYRQSQQVNLLYAGTV